jgi:hypothetical protein
MRQSLGSAPPSGTWVAGSFTGKAPMGEGMRCPIIYDGETGKHRSGDPHHQKVLDYFDRWRAIADGTFSVGRELALLSLFEITDVSERVREQSSDVCPNYGALLDLYDYRGKTREIMRHTQTIHLNRAGLDHFGVPIFDFELLRHEGAEGALSDIRESILAVTAKREGRDSDPKAAYYIFQGFRMLRYMERLMEGRTDWDAMAARFPRTPIPGSFNFAEDLSETEKLEAGAFRTYLNKKAAGF